MLTYAKLTEGIASGSDSPEKLELMKREIVVTIRECYEALTITSDQVLLKIIGKLVNAILFDFVTDESLSLKKFQKKLESANLSTERFEMIKEVLNRIVAVSEFDGSTDAKDLEWINERIKELQ